MSLIIVLVGLVGLGNKLGSGEILGSRVTFSEAEDYSNNVDSEGVTPAAFDFRNTDDEATKAYYALDHTKSRRLTVAEEHWVNLLKDIRDRMPVSAENDLCHIYLNKYLDEFNQDTKAVKGARWEYRANIVAENPILTLKMIRRVLVTLLNDTRRTCKDKFPQVEKTVMETLKMAGLPVPTKEDLDDALMGLLRIQYIYGWNATKEIRLGNLGGIRTGAYLYFDDCLALGKKAIEIGAEALAYQWLKSAPLSPPEFESPQEHLNEDMWEHEQSMLALLNLTMLGSWEYMHRMLGRRKQKQLRPFQDFNYYATCRGEVTMSVKEHSQLFCFYQMDWDPYLYINPLKAELLSFDPLIVQIYEFVGNKAVEAIRQTAQQNGLLRSGIINIKKRRTDFDNVRTSMNTWIYDTDEHQPTNPILVNLNRRIERVTGLEVQKAGASNMQVAVYSALGGHYDFHIDSIGGIGAPIDHVGDRIATFLMFLSDVTMGGYTAFPQVGVFAKPVKGSAVLWYPLLLNGNSDGRTQHGGCPVVLGTKEVANRWILQYENMFKHPCSLEPDE